MRHVIILLLTITLFSCGNTNETDNNSKDSKVKEGKVEIKEPVKQKGPSPYDILKAEGNLIGSWEVMNSFSKSKYDFEIFEINGEYKGVMTEESSFIETLTKEDNKYSKVDNEYGEYYVIDSKGDLTLFDKDGDLSEAGYKATKK